MTSSERRGGTSKLHVLDLAAQVLAHANFGNRDVKLARERVCTAAVLPPHQLDLVGKILVGNRVVERHATRRDRRHQVAEVTHTRGGVILSSRKNRLIASCLIASVWSAKCVRVWLIGLASKSLSTRNHRVAIIESSGAFGHDQHLTQPYSSFGLHRYLVALLRFLRKSSQ